MFSSYYLTFASFNRTHVHAHAYRAGPSGGITGLIWARWRCRRMIVAGWTKGQWISGLSNLAVGMNCQHRNRSHTYIHPTPKKQSNSVPAQAGCAYTSFSPHSPCDQVLTARGKQECAKVGMFNSAASRQALSPCRFIVLGREGWGGGGDLTTLGF